MSSCAFNKCKNNQRNTSKAKGVTFHSFPKEPTLREKWTKSIQVERNDKYWIPNASSKVCSDHFQINEFWTIGKGYRKINPRAVPKYKVVKSGRVPHHVAFIMDGNRRYARRNNVERTVGHERGFDKLTETLKWCLDLGIREVTVYAFSIENFKRSPEEVDTLMDIARDKFRRLLDEVDQMNEWGVRMHVAGRLSLLPEDIRSLVSRAMLRTRLNDRLRLNVAYAYTGRDEISTAISEVVDGAERGLLSSVDVSDALMSECCQLGEPQLLVRTSGEVRLSDFMLWQVSNAVLYFTDVLWPDFSIWNLLAAVLHYQRQAPRDTCETDSCRSDGWSDRQLAFLKHLECSRWRKLEEYAVAC